MATFYVEAHEDWNGLTSDFAYWGWNASIIGIPYDTGNLRRSYKLKNNSKRTIKYAFDTTEAQYVNFLEEGIGPVTKYKGFIENGLVQILLSELIFFITTNQTGLLTNKPTVVLRESQYESPFPYERRIMRSLDLHDRRLNADQRKALSQIRAKQFEGEVGFKNYSGKSPYSFRNYKSKSNGWEKRLINLNKQFPTMHTLMSLTR